MMRAWDVEVSCFDSPCIAYRQRVYLRRAANNRLPCTRLMLDDESVFGPSIYVPNCDRCDFDKSTNSQKAASKRKDSIAHRESSPFVLSGCCTSFMMARSRDVDRRLSQLEIR